MRDTGLFKDVIVAKELTEEYKAFSPKSEVFANKEERERLKLMCLKYGEKLYPNAKYGEHPLGYDDSQALIIFDHNVPNNTLPIIWASPRNEKTKGVVWYPLWERKCIPDSSIAVKTAYKSTYTEKPKPENTVKENLDSIRNHPSLRFYIPLNCGETIYSRESDNDLEQEVNKFINGTSSVLLLLGDSGSGKSTFCTHLALRLIDQCQKDDNSPLPVLIRLGSAKSAIEHCRLIEYQFEGIGLFSTNIATLKKDKTFVFILDGYDELGENENIITTNKIAEWNAKVIITCRTQYLEKVDDYHSLFSKTDLVSHIRDPLSFRTLYVIPFSDKQVDSYLEKYAPTTLSDDKKWKDIKTYKDKITSIYNLKELSANPLLLSIITQTLPKSNIIDTFSRDKLYEEFFVQWFDREEARLKIKFNRKLFFEFAEKLAFEMFLAGRTDIVYEMNKSLFDECKEKQDNFCAFFTSDNQKVVQARTGCPIQRTGDDKYRFMHKSFQEFCVARKLCVELKENNWGNLNKRLLTEEPAIVHFLSEMDITKENLLAILVKSKTNGDIETASSNAATILNAMRFPFSGLNLSGVRIPRADLSDSVLHQTNFSKSNLSSVTFTNAFLKDADLSSSRMENVKFGEKASLKGNSSLVFSLSFSPDGKILASGSCDNPIQLWEIDSCKNIKKLRGHIDPVHSVSFSHNGKILASGSRDKTIRLWDVKSGKTIKTLKGHGDYVLSVSFRPDGKILASGSCDTTIRLWNVERGKTIKTLRGHSSSVNSISFMPDGKILASGSSDKTIRLWNVERGKTIKTLRGHSSSVNSISFMPDGKILASGSSDKTIRLWDVKSGKTIKTLEGHRGPIYSISFSPDGKILASGSFDEALHLWEVESGKHLKTLMGQSSNIYSVSFSPDGKLLASAGHRKTIYLWEIEMENYLKTLIWHKGPINSLSFSPGGKLLASAGGDNIILLWEVDSKKHIKKFESHNTRICYGVIFSPDGKILASPGANGVPILLWDVASGKHIKTLKGYSGVDVSSSSFRPSISFSPDGKMLASGVDGKTILLWEVVSGKLIKTLKGHSGNVLGITFSSDGKILTSAGKDKAILLWEVASGKHIKTLELCTNNYVNGVSFSPDGKILASTGGYNEPILLWEVASGKHIKTIEWHKDSPACLSFSSDGKILISGNLDNTICLWEVASGKCIKKLEGHNGYVYSVSISPEAKMLASGSADCSIKLWNITNIKKDILLVWSSNFHLFCKGMKARNVKGLSETNRLLLTQRAAILD